MLQKIIHNSNRGQQLCTGVILVILFLVSAGNGLAGNPLTDSEKLAIYNQGKDFFNQATAIGTSDPETAGDLYGKALVRFNRLVDDGGVRNGKLFYNIGNINFLLDDIGRAILNYRRAQQFMPNDPNLVKNLAYARNLRKDKLGIKEERKIAQTLFFFHYDLDTGTRLVLFGISYIALWIFAAVRIFSPRPYTRWMLVISLLFCLMFGISLYIEHRQAKTDHAGVILESEVIARQGDAESYQPSFEHPLHAGTEFLLLEDRGSWWQVELPDGRSCWIPAKSAELVQKG